ncbi:hypothetical protein WG66_008139 [Moniliophthora roreri]|nr:hypothetical protein WG66_008139 [Moniliophthora roreri]
MVVYHLCPIYLGFQKLWVVCRLSQRIVVQKPPQAVKTTKKFWVGKIF